MSRPRIACLLALSPAAALTYSGAVAAAPATDPPQPPAALVASGGYRSEPWVRAHGPGDWSVPGAPPTAVTPAPLPAAFCQ